MSGTPISASRLTVNLRGPTVKCLTQSSIIYDHGRDKCFTGIECLALLGFPCSDIAAAFDEHGFSDCELRRLAGQGMALPSLAVAMFCFTLNSKGVWWRQPPDGGAHKRQRLA